MSAEVMIWNPTERLLWGLTVAFLLINAMIYFSRSKEKKVVKERLIFLGFGCLFLFGALSRLAHFYADLAIPGALSTLTFIGDYAQAGITFQWLTRLGLFFYFACFIPFFFAYEFNYKKSKYILTIFETIFSVSFLISPYELIETIRTFAFMYSGFVAFVVLIIFTKWSQVEFKAISTFLVTAFIMIGEAVALSSVHLKNENIFPLFLAPLIMLIGCFFALIPMVIQADQFAKVLKVWVVLGFITIGFYIPFIIYMILFNTPVYMIINQSLFLVVVGYVEYYTIKDIRMRMKFDEEEVLDVNRPDILKMLSRPDKITEEELAISKERGTCLVCKGKLQRQMYICPECMALYCNKCAAALMRLENACWVCEAPLDESKPVKKTEEKDDEPLEIEGKSQKNGFKIRK